MFQCGFCEKTTEPGQKKTMRPVELREVEYRGPERRADGSWTKDIVFQGRGYEIVREKASCEPCLKIPVVPKVTHLSEVEEST